MAILKSLVCLFLLSFSVIYALQPRQSDQFILENTSSEIPSLSSNPEQLSSDLKKSEECGDYETWSLCEAHCEKSCDNYEKPLPCPRFCAPGCVCEKGYVRDDSGTCIRVHQCPVRDEIQTVQAPPRCRVNEYFDMCKGNCQKNCFNFNRPCPDTCVSGCVCKTGFVRGPRGLCMPVRLCPIPRESQPIEAQPKCSENEYFEVCKAHCQKDCNNYDKQMYCSATCVSGCVCKEGYVKGPEGSCIPVERCPSSSESSAIQTATSCPAHEQYHPCMAHCQRDCSNLDLPVVCPFECIPGCICDVGYVRMNVDAKNPSRSRLCVLPKDCPPPNYSPSFKAPPICPENERFSVCNSHCQKNCSNFDLPIHCPALCIPGCVCERGYVRGPQGKCIPSQQCPLSSESQLLKKQSFCPDNEHFDMCKSHCQKSCTNYNEISLCSDECTPGCVCDQGLVRGPQGKCIPVRQCLQSNTKQSYVPPFDRNCPPREHWEFCTGHCQRNCSNYDKPLVCPQICVEGCLCDRGYTRGPRGNCIPENECTNLDEETTESPDALCSEIEDYSSCDAYPMCQKTCSNYDKPISCPKICVSGCVCKEGYVKSSDGECTPVEECLNQDEQLQVTEPRECPRNKHYSRCGGSTLCQETCSSFNKPDSCAFMCIEGCVCDEGFVLGPVGDCIPPSQCPQSKEMDSVQNQFPMPILCQKDEVFSICATACPDDCFNHKDTDKRCKSMCSPGCVCKKGTVRGPDGDCINPQQCPVEKKPEDCSMYEYYDTCGTACPDDCTNYNQLNKQCTQQCVTGCFCQPGFVRGPNGDCIFPFNCPKNQNAPLDIQQNQQVSAEGILDRGCPNDKICNEECRSRGRSYGVCIGPARYKCQCF